MTERYRTSKEIMKLFRFTSRTTFKKYINFINDHEGRYGPDAVRKESNGQYLVDVDAFSDAHRFCKYIDLGRAPEYKGGYV